jgi:hypothetical protein
MNDLATPFLQVFLSPAHQSHIISTSSAPVDLESDILMGVDDPVLSAVEADTFWCLTKLLDGIQDNYTPTQPGIQRSINRLRELVSRIDGMD